MTTLNKWIWGWTVFLVCTGCMSGQTFNVLAKLDETTGFNPEATLVQGTDGNLYGTALYGGNPRGAFGTIFKVTPEGEITTIYRFCSQQPSVEPRPPARQPECSDGAEPIAGLIQATDGNFYGTTMAGGTPRNSICIHGDPPGCGTIFKITPEGRLTTLYNFCSPICHDGIAPFSALLQATNGRLYGTASAGGLDQLGTIFEITTEGDFRTVQDFDFTDGGSPGSTEAMIEAPDGGLYGTTVIGGAHDQFGEGGTVFTVGPKRALTAIYSFCAQPDCADGDRPGGLIQGTDGNFYGTTAGGGANQVGTLFEVTPDGTLTTLHSFCAVPPNCRDGAIPYGRPIQATNGHIYGTTYSNGANGAGTIYEFSPEDGLTTLYNFCSQPGCSDGGDPAAGLLQATNGKFYGTTYGNVFSLDVGLGPFVAFVRGAGRVGLPVGILGQGFTGTTGVSFNGVPASFTVVSDTFLKATVPAGATTGYVTATTPSGVLKSNVPFHVIP